MGAGWQYHAHADFNDDLLKRRASEALKLIAGKSDLELLKLGADTRPLHSVYFAGLTPLNAAYFAGYYRGEDFASLKHYAVSFGGRSGVPPALVSAYMLAFSAQIERLLATHDIIQANDAMSSAEKLYRLSEVAAGLFVGFLEIHPFADGNGHMSRFLIHICFARYGHKRLRMPLHPRPKPPSADLATLIEQFRAGARQPLVLYFLSTV